jgi:hypothetical protein
LVAVAIIMGVLMVGVIVLMVLVFTKPDVFTKKQQMGISYEEAGQTGKQAENKGNMQGQNINLGGDTKDFIPFENRGLMDNAIDLGYHTYRAIIEVSSLNFFLMSNAEQEVVESSYQRFLNSINFPIEIYTQSREFDSQTMMENLEEAIRTSTAKFEGISEYGRLYAENMKQLTEYTGNSKIKKKFIIVPFDSTDLTDMSALTASEIKDFALEELNNRCNIVQAGLEGIGLETQRLTKPEIAECIYAYYHRNMYRIANDFVFRVFDSLAVNGADFTPPDRKTTLMYILNEAQNKINSELRNLDCSIEEDKLYRYINGVLEYFKSDEGQAEIMYELQEKESEVEYDEEE